MKYLRSVLTLALLCCAVAAYSQAEGGTPAETPTAQTVKEELDQLKEVVTDPEGAIQSAVADTNKMKRIKLSGYVQFRYENHQGGGGPGSGTKNYFNVRRARVKATANPAPHTQIVVQPEFGGTSFHLKDAYIDWFPMAAEAGASWMLRAGQLNWPFGYQIELSSSVRETPERAQVMLQLFPGERDRGFWIGSPGDSSISVRAGLFNGTGINANDTNNYKDVVGNLRWAALPNLDLGASFYVGQQLSVAPVAAVPAGGPTPVFQDANGNGTQDAGEPTVGVIAGTPARPAVPARETDKTRYGVDLQWIPFTGATVKAEYVTGKQFVNTASVKNTVVTADGWYAQATYALTPRDTAVVMYDTYDDTSPDHSKDTWHFGVIRRLTDNTRLKLFYQVIQESMGASKENNVAQVELISTY